MKAHSVLVVAAHPDDEVLGLGGTISKLAADGAKIHLLILTDGSSAQYRNDPKLEEILKEKERETQACAEILGIETVDYGGFPDMKLDTVPHILLNQCIERAVEAYRPEIVFTHFWGDVNRDHQCAFSSTMVAVRPAAEQCVKQVFCYRTPSSTEWNVQTAQTAFMATCFTDISLFQKKKAEAIACYAKELREYPHPRSLKAIEIADMAMGVNVGAEYAEAFVVARMFL